MTPLHQVKPIRIQKEITYNVLRKRLDEILPVAMDASRLDMWLIICQEDNLDPVFRTMIPMDSWPKVLQILIFYKDEECVVERLNLSMTDTGDLYVKPWAGGNPPEQWELLREIVGARDPKNIGINIGDINWSSGGLTHNLYNQLVQALPEKYVDRLTSAEDACTRWLMTLSEEELRIYPEVSALARKVITHCYSPESITPGVTTVKDLEWLFWQVCKDLGVEQSFKPYFRIIRRESSSVPLDDGIIRKGDLIVCDVGTRYLGLITDHQELVYIRREGEDDAPDGLKRLFSLNNRLQDIFMAEFKHGITGNKLLKNIMTTANEEGLPNPWIFSHSVGLYLHEPGPVIGVPWNQDPLPGRGDVKIEYNSCYAMELSIKDHVPEWDNQLVPCQTEHLVVFTEDGCRLIDGRQTEYHLI